MKSAEQIANEVTGSSNVTLKHKIAKTAALAMREEVLREVQSIVDDCWPHGQFESFNEHKLSDKLRELERAAG